MRGLEKQLSCERLKVNLLVERRALVHVDTLDLYAARARRAFLQEAAAELFVEEAALKQDLGHVLLDLELRQDALIRERVARHRQPEPPVMTELERTAALELLQDPQLLTRIAADYAACGLVGEETNKLVCYLAGVSRLLPRPLSVLIQSSSAAGKTALLEATLALMPPEAQLRWSALTSQSLYYSRDGAVRDAQAIRTRHQCAQRLLEPLGVVIPWAEELTFRTDQTRFRRDHAKYLALIASVTLLHQYQRQEIERVRDGVAERCVVATLADLHVAHQLATAVLAPRPDALLPQTRQLLEFLTHYVDERCARDQVPRHDVHFTQRDMREASGWSDRALRRQLARLVELEYVVAARAPRGVPRQYRLLYDGPSPDLAAWRLGLADVAQLPASRGPRARGPAAADARRSAPAV